MIKKPSPYSGMIDDEFEFFIRTTYPSDFESMTAKYPKQSIEQLWPEQWDAFKHMSEKFQELIAENTKLDRERNQYRDQVTVYKQRMAQAGGLIAQYFKLRLGEPELTIKAVQNSLIGHGEP